MNFPVSRRTRERGSMLIVALGILTLLSLLAVTFVTLMNLERSAAVNYVDSIKAKMAAEAGIQRIVADVRRIAGKPLFDSSGNFYPFVYHSLGGKTMDVAYPVEELKKDQDPYFYGIVGRSYTTGKPEDAQKGLGVDEYKVKVIDTSALLDLNYEEFILNSEKRPEKGQVFELMLDYLGQALSKKLNVADPIKKASFDGPGGNTTGAAAICAYRATLDGAKFRAKSQLMDIMPEDSYRIVRDYLTAHGPIDAKAVTAAHTTKANHSKVKLSPRAQLNINLAPREVLVAAIAPIAGRRFVYNIKRETQDMEADNQLSYFGTTGTGPAIPAGFDLREDKTFEPDQQGFVYIGDFGLDNAERVADWIIKKRPFKSYAQFYALIKKEAAKVVDDGDFAAIVPNMVASRYFLFKPSGGWNQVGSDNNLDGVDQQEWFPDFVRQGVYSLLLANFAPMFISNTTAPNTAGYLPIDKGSLLFPVSPTDPNPHSAFYSRQTYDFCFDTSGTYEVTSLGQIKGKSGEIVAQEKIFTVVRVLDRVSLRTQYDFERNDNIFKENRDHSTTWPEPKFTFSSSTVRLDEPSSLLEIPWGYVEVSPKSRYFDGDVEPPDSILPMTAGSPLFAAFFDGNQVGTDGGLPPGCFLHGDVFWNASMGGPDGALAAYDRAPTSSSIGTFARARGELPDLSLGKRLGAGAPYPGGTIDWRVRAQGTLLRDGLITSYRSGRSRTLWFRAGADEDDDKKQGVLGGATEGAENNPKANEGNINYRKGSVQFWYKPEYDWSYVVGGSLKATPLFAGLMSASRVFMNPRKPSRADPQLLAQIPGLPDPGYEATPSDGTQLYVFRNTEGFLRATRIYFRAVGDPIGSGQPEDGQPEEIPREILDIDASDQYGNQPGPGGLPAFMKGPYVQGGGEGGAAELYREGTLARPFTPAATAGQPPSGYPWPPIEFVPDDMIAYARVDAWVPYENSALQQWRANEWHHIAVVWDDTVKPTSPPSGNDSDANLKIFVDGIYRSELHSIGLPDDPMSAAKKNQFVRLNEKPYWKEVEPAAQEEQRNPRDTIFVGGFVRRLARSKAGLLKFPNHVEDASGVAKPNEVRVFACGTIDDFAIMDGTNLALGNRGLQRFEAAADYNQNLDLEGRFPGGTGSLELASLSWTALLPMQHGRTRFFDGGRGEVEIKLAGPNGAALVGTNIAVRNMLTDLGAAPIRAGGGSDPALIQPGQNLTITTRLTTASYDPAQPQLSRMDNIDTPLIGDFTLSYFLPYEDTLLKERILD